MPTPPAFEPAVHELTVEAVRAPRIRRRGRIQSLLLRLAIGTGDFQARLQRSPRKSLAALVSVTLVLGVGVFRLRMDNGIENWVSGERPAAALWSAEADREFLVVVRDGVDPETSGFADEDRRLTAALAGLPGVAGVESASSILDGLGRKDLASLGDGAKFFENFLVYPQSRSAVLRVILEPGTRRPEALARVKKAADESVRREAGLARAEVLGPAAFNVALDERSRAESTRAFPLGIAAVFAVLTAIYRSPLTALALLFQSLVGLIWFLGAAGWCGVSLNFVTVNVPVIAFVIALAVTIHPYSAWRRLAARAARTGAPTLRQISLRAFPGCFLSVATAVLGFDSLGMAPVPALREFGILTAVATAIVFAANLLTFPLWMRIIPRWKTSRPREFPLVGIASGTEAVIVRCGAGLLLVAALALASRIPIDHSPLDFFAKDDPFRRSYDEASRKISGLAPLEYRFDLPPGPLAERLRLLEKAAGELSAASGAPRTLSAVDQVKLVTSLAVGGAPGSFKLPDDDAALLYAIDEARKTSTDFGRFLEGGDAGAARVILLLQPIGGREFQRIQERIQEKMAARLGGLAGASAAPMGLIHRLVAVQDRILEGQIVSLSLASLAIAVLVGLFLGSLRLMAAAFFINLLSLSLTAAVMGLFGLPLDLLSTMVASVALGIAIDDTIHILWEHRHLSRTWRDGARAARSVFSSVGPPLTVTTLVLMSGFAALGIAAFPPLVRFGLLTALTLSISLVVHLTVLPSFLPKIRSQEIHP